MVYIGKFNAYNAAADDYEIIEWRTALLEELGRVHNALELGARNRRNKRIATSCNQDELTSYFMRFALSISVRYSVLIFD